MLEKFKHGMTPLQDCTTTIDHDIELQTSEPATAKFYPVHVKLKEHFDKEVDLLLKLKNIQPSCSGCSSPVVIVQTSDGSYRMTIDYRALNSEVIA